MAKRIVMGRTVKSYVVFLLLVIYGILNSKTAGAEFEVFDATLYLGKPKYLAPGIKPIRVVYRSEIWEQRDPGELPDPAMIKKIMERMSDKDVPIVIDIEHWPLTGKNDRGVQENLGKYKKIVSWFREFAPQAKIGFYGRVPIGDYWRAIDGRRKGEFEQWKAENTRAQSLADAVDALYPSLYTFYRDREGWVRYAKAQIAEARRLAKGKPVYVFLWPQYHESNRILGLKYIAPDYWKLQLETARQYADGVVIWGGYKQKWDWNAKWYVVTKQFLENLRATEKSR